MRTLRTFREGVCLLGDSPSAEQLSWTAKDYDIISIESGENSHRKKSIGYMLSMPFLIFVNSSFCRHIISFRMLVRVWSFTYRPLRSFKRKLQGQLDIKYE